MTVHSSSSSRLLPNTDTEEPWYHTSLFLTAFLKSRCESEVWWSVPSVVQVENIYINTSCNVLNDLFCPQCDWVTAATPHFYSHNASVQKQMWQKVLDLLLLIYTKTFQLNMSNIHTASHQTFVVPFKSIYIKKTIRAKIYLFYMLSHRFYLISRMRSINY